MSQNGGSDATPNDNIPRFIFGARISMTVVPLLNCILCNGCFRECLSANICAVNKLSPVYLRDVQSRHLTLNSASTWVMWMLARHQAQNASPPIWGSLTTRRDRVCPQTSLTIHRFGYSGLDWFTVGSVDHTVTQVVTVNTCPGSR